MHFTITFIKEMTEKRLTTLKLSFAVDCVNGDRHTYSHRSKSLELIAREKKTQMYGTNSIKRFGTCTTLYVL